MADKRKDSKDRILRTGEGQNSDGRYTFQYTDANGKRQKIYSWKLVETDKLPEGKRPCIALRTQEKQILKDLDDGIQTDDISVNDLFDQYLKIRTDLSETTLATNICLYDTHVRSGFGKKKIGKIKHTHVYTLYSELKTEKKLKLSTIQSINSILWELLETATKDNLIRQNPVTGEMQKIRSRFENDSSERHALTVDEQTALLHYVYHKSKYRKYGVLFTVLLGTGMRIGEALGLTWDDVDFEKGMILVTHAITYKPGVSHGYEYHVSPPKTSAGIRMIPMFQDVKTALQEQKKSQDKRNSFTVDDYTGFIFVNGAGKIYTPGFIYEVIQNIVTDYNREEMLNAAKEKRDPLYIPKISAHILRHTFCTRICENETNLGIIKDVMGHKNIRTTMNVYNEATVQAKQASFCNLEGKIRLR